MLHRTLFKTLLDNCFKQKVIILIGARQVGKTTLLKELTSVINKKCVWLNADEADILEGFNSAKTSTQLLNLVGQNTEFVVIDEAQQIPDIGMKLKLLNDTKPDLQIIATGSSAFELQNETCEPLTGRKRTFYLFPISYQELVHNGSAVQARRLIETRMIYGSYPEVINNPSEEKQILLEVAHSYLYKDILKLDGIRKSSHIEKLLQALAFQIGSEVNYHELSKTIGNIDTATVEKYIGLLEKAQVIFKLPAFSRNLRNELKKGKKYFFYDNGIRNVLLNNFSNLEFRMDKGALWENYLISERLKNNHYTRTTPHCYFWRTHDQAEIDYLEESDGQISAFEFKWASHKKVRFPKSFLAAYPNHTTKFINRSNFEAFVLGV